MSFRYCPANKCDGIFSVSPAGSMEVRRTVDSVLFRPYSRAAWGAVADFH